MCAELNKSYTTISQVLNDTTTFAALVSNSNAVDYMARSTSWTSTVCSNSTAMSYIGTNDYCATTLLANSTWKTAICNSTYFENVLTFKIPTMTSNTTPSGTASYTNGHYGNDAYKSFNGNDNDAPLSTQNATYPWEVRYTFTSNHEIYKIKVVTSAQYNQTSTIKIQLMYTIGDSWIDAGTISRTSSSGKKTDNFILSAPITAKAIRANYTYSSSMYGEYVQTLQAWGR